MVCRDGADENFEGLPSPVCVGICDRRIFDDCKEREACRVQQQKAVCVDPCKEQKCDESEVCEVAPRGELLRESVLTEAEPYCLACDNERTKFACDKKTQCKWSPGDEA